MSKILVVFGATGQQGGSIVKYVINDPELSKQFKVRGVTRDPSNPAAITLQQKGVEVVKGDFDDSESVKQAVQGAHTVFLATTTVYDEQIRSREYAQGKTVVDSAVAAGAQYFIFSTLSNMTEISGGKYQHGDHFNVKYDIEQYIRAQPLKSAFFAPGSFMQNFANNTAPRPVGDGTYAISNIVTPQTKFPFIDINDTGKYVGAILAEPEKYEGTIFSAATALYSLEEVAEIMSKVTGKTVKYNQLPIEVFKSFMPPVTAEHLADMFLYVQDFGYYGPKTKELVAWAGQNARGKLNTIEDYLAENPLNL